MSIKQRSLVYWLLVVAAFAIMLAAMFFTVGGLLSMHHSRLSDNFIYAGTAMAIIMAIAIVGILAIWAIKFVVLCVWVLYIWTLMTVLGEKRAIRRHA